MLTLDGKWRVKREGGLLPPFGLRKFIAGDHGWTLLGPLPVAPFKVAGTELKYRMWPLRDELEQLDDGTWVGRGYVLGRQFCTFRMERRYDD